MLRLIKSLKFYKSNHQPLYRLGVVVLFWALADAIMSFALPVFLKQVLGDLFLVGLVFSTSSFFGLIMDLYLGSEQKGRSFRPYFFTSFVLAIVAYFLVFKAYSWPIFLLIMACWGFYFEAFNFGVIDFLARFAQKKEHAQFSGVIQVFYALGYLLAPITVGLAILKGRTAMVTALVFMFWSLLLFIFWFSRQKIQIKRPVKKLTFWKELKIWQKVGKKSFKVLTGIFLLNIWDSIIWGLGPILLVASFGSTSAYIMACFVVPRVVLQGYAGFLADKKNKKQFLVWGLIVAGGFLSLFSLSNNLFYKIFTALGSAVGAAFVWPAVDGLFIDIVGDYQNVEEEEIAGTRGLAANLGYIIGPILTGFLASQLGLSFTFLLCGIFLIIGAVLISK